jgi:hypothetical protein
VVALEIGPFRSTGTRGSLRFPLAFGGATRLPFFEADDGMFCENSEIAAYLCLVTLDAPSEISNRFDLLTAKHVDEFAAFLGQDAFGALVADDMYACHSAFGECACHFLPALSTRDLFRTGSRLVTLVP